MNIQELIPLKNFNWKTILSLLFLVAGFLFWVSWGITYGVWVDIGIYSVVVLFVLGGLAGIFLSLREQKQE
ncbi:MAG: hypothetical protein QXX20_01905 [Candidatus Thermoplasmatota archaeon]